MDDEGRPESIYRALFMAAPEALLVADDKGMILFGNPRAHAQFVQPDLHGCAVERLLPGLADARQGPPDPEATCTLEAQRGDGGRFVAEVGVRRLELAQSDLVMLTVRECDEAARQARRISNEFVASMSHALRTPLNSILGFARLMQHGRLDPISQRQHEYLGDIINSGNHLLSLINGVLDLARFDAGRIETRPEPIDLAQLIGEVREVVGPAAALKRLRIEASVDPGCTDVELDPARLKQILYNYLSNAVKFTDRGQIDVRVLPQDPDALRIEVHDCGQGIAPEELPRLFSGVGRGGFGLALTRRIAEALGGHTGVESQPGQGSTFYAVLPRAGKRTHGAEGVQDG